LLSGIIFRFYAIEGKTGSVASVCTKHLYNEDMKTLKVSEFREQCLALLEHLPADGILITKRGEPIARVLPVKQNNADLIGRLAGLLEVHGDIMSTGEEWDAES
jgi:antitoxin (DNA-binding transcriptional repressor) of toxin-antitoxin stability system